MYEIQKPKPNTIELLKDDFLTDIRQKVINGEISNKSNNYRKEFVELFHNTIQSSKCFELKNLEMFEIKETIIGCHHFIDSILIKNSISNVQVLEHEYKYYERLNPNWNWATQGNLLPDQPLIIATPFPGYLDVHPDFEQLLDETLEKNIDVHLDCAWLTCSKDLTIDVSHPSIKSIGISLSKGYASSWNRIGLRYTKVKDPTDPITIFDNADMCPESIIRNGICLLEHIPIDYMWNKYSTKYYSLIKEYNLTLGKILFAAYGKDRVIYSLSHLLTH